MKTKHVSKTRGTRFSLCSLNINFKQNFKKEFPKKDFHNWYKVIKYLSVSICSCNVTFCYNNQYNDFVQVAEELAMTGVVITISFAMSADAVLCVAWQLPDGVATVANMENFKWNSAFTVYDEYYGYHQHFFSDVGRRKFVPLHTCTTRVCTISIMLPWPLWGITWHVCSASCKENTVSMKIYSWERSTVNLELADIRIYCEPWTYSQ